MESLNHMWHNIKYIWRYHIHYATSRYIIHFGVWLMPEGPYKILLLNKMYEVLNEVRNVIELNVKD